MKEFPVCSTICNFFAYIKYIAYLCIGFRYNGARSKNK
jgi:hypothetical protein